MSLTATPPPPPRLTPASPPEGDEENGKKQKKDRIAQHVGPKQNPKSTIFADCAFSFAGRLSKTTKEFVDLVTDHGGQVIMTATKKATHVVTARKFIEEQEKTKDEEGVKLCTNIMFGLKYDIPIVDEHFILDSVNANPPTLAKLKQYDLTAKCKELEAFVPPKEEGKGKKSKKAKKARKDDADESIQQQQQQQQQQPQQQTAVVIPASTQTPQLLFINSSAQLLAAIHEMHAAKMINEAEKRDLKRLVLCGGDDRLLIALEAYRLDTNKADLLDSLRIIAQMRKQQQQ